MNRTEMYLWLVYGPILALIWLFSDPDDEEKARGTEDTPVSAVEPDSLLFA